MNQRNKIVCVLPELLNVKDSIDQV